MLRRLGHDVLDVKESKQYGTSDQEIYRIACKEDRTIFTTDERFRNYDPRLCGGIIVSLITPNTPLRYEPRLKHLLLATRSDDLRQKTVLLEEKRHHILDR
jgi:predicted nuclease of predicted toxin-antitoxin system